MAPFLAKKYQGMSLPEAIAYSFEILRAGIDAIVGLLSSLIKLVYKDKTLPGN